MDPGNVAKLVEVADTAVKIGLGALIAGAFTLWGMNARHRHELSKELSRRRQDTLEDVSKHFEAFHSIINELGVLCASWPRIRGDVQKALNLKGRFGDLHVRAQDVLKSIQILEGRLLLVGMETQAATMARYRREVIELLAFVKPQDALDEAEKMTNKLLACENLRIELYQLLSQKYRNG